MTDLAGAAEKSRLLRLAFSDFPGRFNPDRLLALLQNQFAVEEVNQDPDYVIHSVFGYEFLRYESAIRIAFIGENVRPDFNLSDYAFGYDWLQFGDRYQRAPNFLLYPSWQLLLQNSQSEAAPAAKIRPPGFCAFLYSNTQAQPMRDQLLDRLAEIAPVDSAGGHRRNMAALAVKAYASGWEEAALEWFRHYRFVISVENSSTPGYTTEKIVQALAAGSIPIYHGDPYIERVFNPERMINVHRLGLEGAIAKVQELEADPQAYAAVVAQTPFTGGAAPRDHSLEHLLAGFSHIFRQTPEQAKRRTQHFWGPIYEQRHRAAFCAQ